VLYLITFSGGIQERVERVPEKTWNTDIQTTGSHAGTGNAIVV
jgi:hypothetical protein